MGKLLDTRGRRRAWLVIAVFLAAFWGGISWGVIHCL
ncbi:hypothetical protein MKleb_5476 (plasmid) [Klebsiella sp. PL-2018]|nr:hypothetical protein MKleb_5476 [Klebsiella sp. PL-2018]